MKQRNRVVVSIQGRCFPLYREAIKSEEQTFTNHYLIILGHCMTNCSSLIDAITKIFKNIYDILDKDLSFINDQS